MQMDVNVYLFLLQLQINMLIRFSKRHCQYEYSFIDWVKPHLRLAVWKCNERIAE